MTTTTFTAKETVIEAAWANDVDALVYDIFNAMSSVGADGTILVSDGTNFVKEAVATARTSLGLGTGDSPQFTGIEVGHATDTTITRASAGTLVIVVSVACPT